MSEYLCAFSDSLPWLVNTIITYPFYSLMPDLTASQEQTTTPGTMDTKRMDTTCTTAAGVTLSDANAVDSGMFSLGGTVVVRLGSRRAGGATFVAFPTAGHSCCCHSHCCCRSRGSSSVKRR